MIKLIGNSKGQNLVVMNEEALMGPFDFTLDDLIQNRHHLISQRQFVRLRRMRLEASILPMIGVWFAGGFALSSLAGSRGPNQVLTFIATASLAIFCAYIGLTRWIRISSDLRKRKVSLMHGKVIVGAVQTRNIGYYGAGLRLTSNGLGFIIPFDAGDMLSRNVRYSIYFLPESNIILSMERARR